MNKEDKNNNFSSRISGTNSAVDEYDLGGDNLSLRDYGKDISDTVSVTSEKVIDEPLRRLEMQYGG